MSDHDLHDRGATGGGEPAATSQLALVEGDVDSGYSATLTVAV